jgi:hypothetical protein
MTMVRHHWCPKRKSEAHGDNLINLVPPFQAELEHDADDPNPDEFNERRNG